MFNLPALILIWFLYHTISLGKMNTQLAVIFTQELSKINDLYSRSQFNNFRITKIQKNLNCCGFHTALDYCYPESVKYFDENLSRYGQKDIKIAAEAFDDMLRATKDQQFLLDKYHSCTNFNISPQYCQNDSIIKGCKIELKNYMHGKCSLVTIILICLIVLWFIVLLFRVGSTSDNSSSNSKIKNMNRRDEGSDSNVTKKSSLLEDSSHEKVGKWLNPKNELYI